MLHASYPFTPCSVENIYCVAPDNSKTFLDDNEVKVRRS